MTQGGCPPVPTTSARRRMLVGLTTLLTGVLLGLTGPAEAASAPSFTTSPAGLGNDSTVTWAWTADPAATTTCILSTPGPTRTSENCSSPWTTTLTDGDGAYTLLVEAARSTADGGVELAVSEPSAIVLDTEAPAVTIDTGPISPSTERRPSWALGVEAGASATCRLIGPQDAILDGSCGTGSWTADLTDRPEGPWTLTVSAQDPAGNTATTTANPYVLDVAPAAPQVTPAVSPDNDPAPGWTFTVPAGASALCSLAGPTRIVHRNVACASGWSPSLTNGNGVYTASVVLEDGGGRSAAGSAAYTLDTVAPARSSVDGPSGRSSDATPHWSFTVPAGTAARCTLLGASATTPGVETACSSPHLPQVADGTWQLSVVLVDEAGNRSRAATSPRVTVDTTPPPPPSLTRVPASPNNGGGAARFTWNWTPAQRPDLTECQVRAADGVLVAWQTCSGGTFTQSTTDLADGLISLDLRSRDDLLNRSDVQTSTVQLDTTGPDPVLVRAPPSPGRTYSPAWALLTAGVHECRLSGPGGLLTGWSICADGYTGAVTGRQDGSYALHVRTHDAAGNVSLETTSAYLLDTSAPLAAGVAVGPSPSSDSNPVWIVTAPEPGVEASCRLLHDGAQVREWASCPVTTAGTSHPISVAGRPDGGYRLEVRLTDPAGNTGPVAGAEYLYDTTAPAAVLVTGPISPSPVRAPVWLLVAEPGTRLECRLSGQTAFTRCAADGVYTGDLLQSPDGNYELTVRAVDAAGNVGQEGVSTYVLDTAPPLAPVVAGPGAGAAQERTPAWRWAGDTATSALCAVTRDGVEVWSGACSTPFSVELPHDGTYLLSVRLVDAAGNTSLAGTASYVLDTTAPAPPVVAGPSSPSSLQSPAFSFDAESGAVVQCRVSFGADAHRLEVDPAGWHECEGGSLQIDATEPGLYRLEVRAADAAGNISEIGAYDYEYDADAPAGLRDLVLPMSPGRAPNPEWTFTADEGSTTVCHLEGPGGLVVSSACTGGFRPGRPLGADGRYLLRIVVTDANGNVGTNDALYVLDTTGPEAPIVTPMGAAGRTGQVPWGWVGDATASWRCRLWHDEQIVAAWRSCAPGTQQLGEWGEGTFSLEVVGTDPLGNRGASGRGSYTWETAGPAALGVTTASPTRGGPGPVRWAFPVPADAVSVTCGVRRGGTAVRAMTGCSGDYTMDLTGLRDGTYEVVVLFVDAQGNPTEQVRTYVLNTSAIPRPPPPATGGGGGGGKGGGAGIIGPPPPGPSASTAVRPRRPTAVAAQAPTGVVPPPGLLSDEPVAPARTATAPAGLGKVGEAVEQAVGRPGFGIPGGVLSGSAAVGALKDVAEKTIRRPQLPIVLLLVVGLFLLVQNRIDRRDPKLAGAPVDGDPQLEFRRPLLPPPVGGAPA